MTTYQYTPLPELSIRLLHLLPGKLDDPLYGALKAVHFAHNKDDEGNSAKPEFEALSYVWGDQSDPDFINITEEWSINERNRANKPFRSLPIGRNLASALRYLRYLDRPRVLWCDSICVNQADLDERAAQVLRMQDIFPGASRVVIWLGPAADNSDLALEALEYLSSLVNTLNKLPDSREKWQAVEKLISRSWFRRLWIRQEIALARKPFEAVVAVGGKQILWWQLTEGVRCLQAGGASASQVDDWVSFYRDVLALRQIRLVQFFSLPPDLIEFTKQCECSDDQDRVFAIMSLIDQKLEKMQKLSACIDVDYRLSAKHVYKGFFLWHTRIHQSLRLLHFCDSADRPTWVPDFHKLQQSPTLTGFLGQASACAPISFRFVDGDKIGVSGVKFDTITEFLGSVPFGYDDGELRRAVIDAVKGYLGASPGDWAPQALDAVCEALVGGVTSEKVARGHASLDEIANVLKAWASGDPDTASVDWMRFTQVRQGIDNSTTGRSMYKTENGWFLLGPNKCQPGDQVYTILGISNNMVLRPTSAATHLVIGSGYRSGYVDGEAVLGPLPPGWSVVYVMEQGLIRLKYKRGEQQQKHDPRLADVRLPEGWEERLDEEGYPYWRQGGPGSIPASEDPRLSHEELVKRGVKVEEIVLE